MSRLKGFDGMRAIACLAVLFHHLFQRLGVPNSLRGMTDLAEVGVSLFFVLSGALLSYPFWRNYINDEAMPDIRHFFIHRAARIMPSFYLVLAVSACFSALYTSAEAPWLRMMMGFLFIAPYHYLSFFPAELNGPLWSIGLEVSCYVLLPMFLFFAWHLGKAHWLKALALIIFYIFLLQALNPVVIDWFMTSESGKGWQHGLIGGAKQWLPYWNVVSFMTQFICGSLAALVIVILAGKVSEKQRLGYDLLALLSLALSVYIIAQMGTPGAPSYLTGQPYVAPLLALALSLSLVALNFSYYMHRILDNYLFRKIATLSFGIYLWHYLLMELAQIFWMKQFYYNGILVYSDWLLVSGVVIVASVVIATISYYLFELPIMKWARKKTAK